MVVETKFVTIDRDELRELREESAELARLRAQPARQVGGDERDEFRAWFLGRYEYFDNVPSIAQARAEAAWMARAALAPAAVVRNREADRQRLSDPAFNQWLDEVISDAGHTVWDQIPDVYCAWHGWENRQHYAPSAVVMPEQQEYHQIAFEIGGTEDGAYHFEADELDAFVARLNRRAIPVELLERICNSMTLRALDNAVGELRALLGKEEK